MNDDESMAMALAEAKAAGERGEVPVGAVLVGADGAVLARDGNRIVERRDPTAHAEMLVLREAAARLGNERLTRRHALCDAGAVRDVRGRDQPGARGAAGVRGGGSQGRARCCTARCFFAQPTCHHRPQVTL